MGGMDVFDERACWLGEGPLWHPLRQQFFWFDVLNHVLLSRSPFGDPHGPGRALQWRFDEHVSAAGWVDRRHLLLASESALSCFDIETGTRQQLVALEADNPLTRSNDGRADPLGGFWIGTMGKTAQPHAGAIYRYFRGELRRIHGRITIPNSLCFSPDGHYLYFTDTPRRIIYRQVLDALGWPVGSPESFIDLRAEGLSPDGSVVDAQGSLWNAQWGARRVARYHANGRFDLALSIPAVHTSCPAFGGAQLRSLLVTTAQEHLPQPAPGDGLTYWLRDSEFQGLAEPAVEL